jgi:hypothetical protein
MLKTICAVLALGMLGMTLAGCHAEADVGHGQSHIGVSR